MAQNRPDSWTFEFFVAELLRRYDLEIVEGPYRGKDRGYDLKVASSVSQALVEVKLYSTLRIAFDVVRQSYARLSEVMARDNVPRGIFVTNARIPAGLRNEGRALGIAIYDFDVLYRLTSAHSDLAEQFERLLQDSFIYRSEPLPSPDPDPVVDFVNLPPRGHGFGGPNPPSQAQQNSGAQLCARIRSSSAGRKGKAASIFEGLCVESLKYLFSEDFIGWSTQANSHGKLHRYDLIARVSSQNDFWTLMITDHRARYIIFEFKNYADKISQVQIYSTEKYLLPQAMRSTSVIISRRGFNDNAFRVAAGALRESGKLILGLSMDELCEMLHLKDKGEDPSGVMGRKLDELLMGLER